MSSLLFQNNSHLVSVASPDLNALLEYLSVLLEYIDPLRLSAPFQPALVYLHQLYITLSSLPLSSSKSRIDMPFNSTDYSCGHPIILKLCL